MKKLPIDFKDSKTQTMIFAVLASLLFIAVDFNFVMIPQVLRVADVLQKMTTSTSDLKTAEVDISNIEEFRKNLETYKEKVDRYEKMLPAEQEIPSLLENLSTIAKSSNIKIIGITPISTPSSKEKGAQKGQIYQETPILISAKSGYHELGQFICNLENADRFMKVIDIEIKSNRLTPRKHDVELIVCTYTLRSE